MRRPRHDGSMAKAPKLKVFCTPTGFYNALVAAPSQKAALKAWGTTTDLFGAGRASILDDPALQPKALATPGEIVKVRRGDLDEMLGAEPKPERPPSRPPAKRARSARRPTPPRRPDLPAPPLPNRSELDAAEAALAEAQLEHDAELDAIAGQREELDKREIGVRSVGRTRLAELRRTAEAAQKAYAAAVEAREVWRNRIGPSSES